MSQTDPADHRLLAAAEQALAAVTAERDEAKAALAHFQATLDTNPDDDLSDARAERDRAESRLRLALAELTQLRDPDTRECGTCRGTGDRPGTRVDEPDDCGDCLGSGYERDGEASRLLRTARRRTVAALAVAEYFAKRLANALWAAAGSDRATAETVLASVRMRVEQEGQRADAAEARVAAMREAFAASSTDEERRLRERVEALEGALRRVGPLTMPALRCLFHLGATGCPCSSCLASERIRELDEVVNAALAPASPAGLPARGETVSGAGPLYLRCGCEVDGDDYAVCPDPSRHAAITAPSPSGPGSGSDGSGRAG